MNIDTIIENMMQSREDLRSIGDLPQPTQISEGMYKLAQYVSVVEEKLGDLEEDLGRKENIFFKERIKEGKSVNAAQVSMKYQFAEDRAKISKINRLVSSSWKLISVSQSRVKNLIEESKNQI